MNKFKLSVSFIALFVTAITLQSCLNNDDNYGYQDGYVYPNALVTVYPNADNSAVYLQLDDSTTLLPANMKVSPFGTKEVRALANFSASNVDPSPYTQAVNVNWIDSIRTKDMLMSAALDESNIYGTDPVEIVGDWVTIAEDGYLTLRFRTFWGNQKTHVVNLVGGTEPNDPYKVVFQHDANGDLNGVMADALVAFKLTGLPDTQGKTVDLTLQWNSFSGTKTAVFKYCSRKATNPNALNGITKLWSIVQ